MQEKQKSEPSPLCVRMSLEERAWLEHNAGSMTISAFIRWLIFGDDATPRKRRVKRPIKDYVALAQLFALIKQTQIWNNLNQVAKGINSNTWVVTPETEKSLQEACKAIIEIREILIKALGLNESDGS